MEIRPILGVNSQLEGTMSDFAIQALARLRDASNFQWYVIPLLAFVFYVYTVEAEKRNWNLVLAGLAFWGADWFNEIFNSLFFRFNGHAPIWAEPGPSAYLILVGLNIETMFMFAVNALTWDWGWWNRGAPLLIFIFGYLWFFIFAFRVYDMKVFKQKLQVVGGLWAFNALCLVIFAGFLKWI
jgi:hypothetical protein